MPRFKGYKYDEWAEDSYARYCQDAPRVVAIDTETSGFAWQDEAFCVTMSWRGNDGDLHSAYMDIESDEHGIRAFKIQQMLKLAQVWVFHNAKFDLQKLELAGILQPGWNGRVIEDTNIIHALIDENDRHGLKYLAKKLLHLETNEEEVLKKVRRKLKIKKDEGYHLLPREVVAGYAMRDTELTLLLFEYLRPRLPEDCEQLYSEELATAMALLDIEAQGIALDVPYLERTASEYGIKVMRGYQKLAELTDKPDFNPNSPKQIGEAFEKLTGTAPESTDKEHLTKIAELSQYPRAQDLAKTLLEYRRVKKLHGTYLVGMLDEQQGGIIHPNFNLTLPRTGRMSSSAATNN